MKSYFKKAILPFKKVARPQVWKMLDFYERSFAKEGKKAKKFDRMVQQNQICFTTDVNTEGFTDQLARLTFFYKVGKSLGMKYNYTPLNSQRSSKIHSSANESKDDVYSDIYDFLGVNEYLEKISDLTASNNFEDVVVDMDEINFTRRDQDSFSNLIFLLKRVLADKIPENKNVLVHFRASPNVFKLYHLTVPENDYNLNFREVYFQKREKNPQPSKFSKNKINLMLHIRQGDTATVKTPWESYIPVWYKMKTRFQESNNRAEIDDHEVVDVDEYYTFLKKLYEHLEPAHFSTVIYSDGFETALEMIEEQQFYKELSEVKREKWDEFKGQYNQREFEKFYRFTEIKVEIGEEREKLYDLIQSFFEAQIIIFGTQAKFIPKMLSLYSNCENMPLIINLYHEYQPHIEYLGIENSWPQVLFVDLNNVNIEDVANRVKEYLASQNRLPRISESG